MNPVEAYRQETGLTMRALAMHLKLRSPGHVADMIKGRRAISVSVAKELGRLTGRPWHEMVGRF